MCGRALVVAAVFAVAAATPSPSRAELARAPSSLPQTRGLEITGATISLLERPLLRRLRAARATLIAKPGSLTPRQRARLERLASRWSLPVYMPVMVNESLNADAAVAAVSTACEGHKIAHPESRCAALTRSAATAVRLAGIATVDVIVLRGDFGRRALNSLATLSDSARLVILRSLNSDRHFRTDLWRDSIRLTERSEVLDLAATPTGRRKADAVERYLRLAAGAVRQRDRTAPRAPANLTQTGATRSSIDLLWAPSQDNRGVVGYGLYRDGVFVATTAKTSVAFADLLCGTTYLLEVDAVDAAGNRSKKSAIWAPTLSCDADAPTPPTELTVTSTTETTVSLSWTASTDAIGVTAYTLYRDDVNVATTTETNYTLTGLACGTSYAVGVEARDAAGNVSSRTNVTGATAACSTLASADVYISPSGSDTNPCTQPQPCRSFNRAYHVAKPGQIVEVDGGSYGGQVIDLPQHSSGPRIVFRPSAGEQVEVAGTLETRASHVEVRDMYVWQWYTQYRADALSWASADDIAFVRLRAHSGTILGSHGVQVIGGEVGPNRKPDGTGGEDGIFIGAYPPDADVPRDVLIDGVWIHDIQHLRDTDHSDCVQTTGAARVTIARSRLENCADQDIMLKDDQGEVRGFVIENNFLDNPTLGWFAVNLGDVANSWPCADIDVRYNSTTARADYRVDACGQGSELTGNIAPKFGDSKCSQAKAYGWKVDFNVWETGMPCGASDSVGPVSYVSRDAPLDLHLLPSSTATGAGDPVNHPATDIDSEFRTSGVTAAGADEPS